MTAIKIARAERTDHVRDEEKDVLLVLDIVMDLVHRPVDLRMTIAQRFL